MHEIIRDLIALAGVLISAVGTSLVAYLAYLNRKQTKVLEEVRHQTNSMQHEMMALSKEEGVQQERDAQEQREKA